MSQLDFKAFKQAGAKVCTDSFFPGPLESLPLYPGWSLGISYDVGCVGFAASPGDRAVQVKTLVFHPVQPWLAYADVNQTITVWDWTNQQVNSSSMPSDETNVPASLMCYVSQAVYFLSHQPWVPFEVPSHVCLGLAIPSMTWKLLTGISAGGLGGSAWWGR